MKSNTKEIQSLQTKVDKIKAEILKRIAYNDSLNGVIKSNESVIEGERKLVEAYEDQIKIFKALDGPSPSLNQFRAND